MGRPTPTEISVENNDIRFVFWLKEETLSGLETNWTFFSLSYNFYYEMFPFVLPFPFVENLCFPSKYKEVKLEKRW